MKIRTHASTTYERWATLRFSVVGHLLAAPPARGALAARARAARREEMAAPDHRRADDVSASRPSSAGTTRRGTRRSIRSACCGRKVRKDSAGKIAIADVLAQAMHAQYTAHRGWSYQLHHDNLVAWRRGRPRAGRGAVVLDGAAVHEVEGLVRRRRSAATPTDGTRAGRAPARGARGAQLRDRVRAWALAPGLPPRPKKVLIARGAVVTPWLLGILDDHSRLCCHAAVVPRRDRPRTWCTGCRRRSRSGGCRGS